MRALDGPGPLEVVDRSAAGRPATAVLGLGEAIGIATGAVVPEGADAVAPIERVVESDHSIVLATPVVSGENVREQGGDVRSGAEALAAGVLLTPARIAALAACGVETVQCARRPSIAIVTTGTELRPPGSELARGEIYESNGVMLDAALTAVGAIVERLGAVADEVESHRTAIERGSQHTCSSRRQGWSASTTSSARSRPAWASRRSSGVLRCDRASRSRSGTVARRSSSGFPVIPSRRWWGAVFVVPAVLALQGAVDPRPRFLPGVLAAPMRPNAARDNFVRARSRWSATGVELEPITGQESHMIVRSAAADALVRVPRGTDELPAGAVVRYLPL